MTIASVLTSPMPDTCTATRDWSPIVSAPAASALEAVLAGFVFAGIVVILTERKNRGHTQAASSALRLFLTAFLGLLVAAYIDADVAGEQACPRGELSSLFTGGMLGACAIVLMTGLAWLVRTYEQDDNPSILAFLCGMANFAGIFIILLLGVSSLGYATSTLPGSQPLVVYVGMPCTVGGMATVLIRYLLNRRKPPPRDDFNKSVSWCIRIALGFVAGASIAAGVSMSVPGDLWYPHAPDTIVFAAAGLAMAVPAAVVFLSLAALPSASTTVEQSNEAIPLTQIDASS